MATKSLFNIIVKVNTEYLGDQSSPVLNRYVFSYTVTIQNSDQVAAKLLSRHWIITDAQDRIKEVRGEGVVGEQPLLQPGESYQYTSGTLLETPYGCMKGSYHMLTNDGIEFTADIPEFMLAVPHTLH